MNRLCWILASFFVLNLAAGPSIWAAPIREPRGKSRPDQLPAIDLTTLQRNDGVAFGDWSIWRSDIGGESYFIINQKTGLAVYMYWASNGWVNYRTKDGTWYVFYPSGMPSRQDRRDLNIERFLDKKPTVRVAPGIYIIKNWTVTVTSDTMEFFTPSVKSRMQVRRDGPEFMHNYRSIR